MASRKTGAVHAAISLNADQLGFPQATFAFDPMIVLVTSALGWLQMKRHGELTASYNLTAHEIGIIRGNSDAVKTEEEFSDFVNEAELAFSREHTQWVARRDAN
ncbi:MAG: SLATT domain-containing protein [Alphaproteobacteria bacterium]|nr:SLATT domain-containing protein [Alphaproteobacteria bacterium]